MSEFRSLYSLRFADRQQVFRLGTGEEVTPGEGKEVLTCADPIAGHVYGDDPRSGGRNSDAARSAYARLSQTIEWLNFLRGLYDVFGRNI